MDRMLVEAADNFVKLEGENESLAHFTRHCHSSNSFSEPDAPQDLKRDLC